MEEEILKLKEKENEKIKESSKKEEPSKKKEPSSKEKSTIKQQYSNSQIMKEDGYCYIGTDNNMRHCVDAYSGDVCTSGDVYKRMDDCLIPKLGQHGCS